MTILNALAIAALLGTAFPAFTQTAQAKAPEPNAGKTQQAAVEAAPDPATLRAMKSKVFEAKHRSPSALISSLRALSSGVNGHRIDATDRDGLHLLSVRDFPENLAAIEDALKRLDTPAPQQNQSVELRLQVLFASKAAVPDSGIPEGLQGVVKTLKGTLAYRSYALGGDFIQRARVWTDASGTPPSISGFIDPAALGTDRGKEPSSWKVECEIHGGIKAESQKDGSTTFYLQRFQLWLRDGKNSGPLLATFNTDLSLKEGETVVVGTSVLMDRGMVVVLTARRVK